MKKIFYIALFVSCNVFGQWSPDSFDIIFSNDHDALTAGGPYDYSEWNNYHPYRPPWYSSFYNRDNSRILDLTLDGVESQVMRFWFGEDTDYNDSDHGHKYRAWFDADSTGYEELYMSYDIFFPSGTYFKGWTQENQGGSLLGGRGKMPSLGGRAWWGEGTTEHHYPYYP